MPFPVAVDKTTGGGVDQAHPPGGQDRPQRNARPQGYRVLDRVHRPSHEAGEGAAERGEGVRGSSEVSQVRRDLVGISVESCLRSGLAHESTAVS